MCTTNMDVMFVNFMPKCTGIHSNQYCEILRYYGDHTKQTAWDAFSNYPATAQQCLLSLRCCNHKFARTVRIGGFDYLSYSLDLASSQLNYYLFILPKFSIYYIPGSLISIYIVFYVVINCYLLSFSDIYYYKILLYFLVI